MKLFKLKYFLACLWIIPFLSLAQTKNEGPWWPNKQWGAGDQAGASNWITPEKILKAVALVKTGKTIELGHVYERGMPLVGQRSYNIFIPAFPTSGPFGEDKAIFNDEFVAAEIGQVGTQFDGLGHPGRLMKMADGTTKEVFYNGFMAEDMKDPYGLLKLGVENLKPIITRGILIDVAGYKNVNTLSDGYEITMTDIRSTLTKQGLQESDIEPGDALLFNLGWWRIWPDKKTVEGNPAHVSREVADWIVARKPSMVGSDASLDSPERFYVHTKLIMENGIFNLEFMNFSGIQNEKVYKFMFVFTPLRLKGATGSPGRPLAIY
ncbi:MAG: cyclase family protein [Bacteroidota bacterium]